jgi:hypothetical protein
MNPVSQCDRLELALMADEAAIRFVDRKLRLYAAGYGPTNASRIRRRTRFVRELNRGFFQSLIGVT